MPANPRASAAARSSLARACAAALVGGSATLGLAACDPDLIGAAVVVDGQRLSVTQLQDRVTEYTDSLPDPGLVTGDSAAIQTALLERYVRHQLFQELADREGVQVAPADVDAFLEDFAAQQGGDLTGFLAQNGFTQESVRAAVYDELVRQRLVASLGGNEQVEQALGEVAAELGVEVNPRYGEWDGSTLATGSGSLSEPAPGSAGDPLAPGGAGPEGGPAPE